MELKDLKGPAAQRVKQKYLCKGPEIIHSNGTQKEPIPHMLHFISPIKGIHTDSTIVLYSP